MQNVCRIWKKPPAHTLANRSIFLILQTLAHKCQQSLNTEFRLGVFTSDTLHVIVIQRTVVVRSYLGYYAASHPHSAAKRQWARVVVGWVTSREVLVTYPFYLPTHEKISLSSYPHIIWAIYVARIGPRFRL